MTLEEAARCIGARVIYTAPHGRTEYGTISSVSASFVFVQYEGSWQTQATPADRLTLDDS